MNNDLPHHLHQNNYYDRFDEYHLDDRLLSQLTKNNFVNPTHIQKQTLEPILNGEDIFAMAETGSGKTGAFVIPLIQKIVSGGLVPNHQDCLYIVMAPTRELAHQTAKVLKLFGSECGISSACIIGGEDIEVQKEALRQGVHFIVATPGRLIDLFKQKIVQFQSCEAVVFDEADRLFDMGFKDDISFILSKLPKTRQILMFSATNNFEVLNTAYKFGAHPSEINLSKDNILVDNINHSLIHAGDKEKMPLLVGLLRANPDQRTMVFCNTKNETHIVAEWLQNLGMKCRPISGNLPQSKRTKLVSEFREKQIDVLISTDVAARGLDIDDVNLVINYDLPQDPSSYVHRIGRTGRAGKVGRAVSLCAFYDCENLGPIEEYIKEKIPVEQIDEKLLATDLGQRPRLRDPRDERDSRDQDSRRGARNSRNPRTERGDNQANGNTARQEGRGPQRPRTQSRERNPDTRNNRRTARPDETQTRKPRPAAHRSEEVQKVRDLTLTSVNFENAKKEAMTKMGLEREEHLSHEVVEQGSKGFLGLFGKKESTYRFYYNPKYDALAQSFLDKIIDVSHFDLSYKISAKPERLTIDFVGADEELLCRHEYELLESLEFCLRKFLIKKAGMDKDFKVNLTCNGQSNESLQEKKLETLALKMKEKALSKNKPVVLNPLNPRERRIIHQTLSEDSSVTTTSIGNGHYKRIQISPNN